MIIKGTLGHRVLFQHDARSDGLAHASLCAFEPKLPNEFAKPLFRSIVVRQPAWRFHVKFPAANPANAKTDVSVFNAPSSYIFNIDPSSIR